MPKTCDAPGRRHQQPQLPTPARTRRRHGSNRKSAEGARGGGLLGAPAQGEHGLPYAAHARLAHRTRCLPRDDHDSPAGAAHRVEYHAGGSPMTRSNQADHQRASSIPVHWRQDVELLSKDFGIQAFLELGPKTSHEPDCDTLPAALAVPSALKDAEVVTCRGALARLAGSAARTSMCRRCGWFLPGSRQSRWARRAANPSRS